MTREEAIKMAKADLKCMKRDTSGQDEMCNSHKCDECSLNYERGNMGEQKEWLRLAIKALEQKPCEDAVSRKSVITIIQNHWWNCRDIDKLVNELPPVTPQEPRKLEQDQDKPMVEIDLYSVIKQKYIERDVLDKIRAEIDKARFIDKDTRIVKNALASGLEVALQIIDKYKAESEVMKDGNYD